MAEYSAFHKQFSPKEYIQEIIFFNRLYKYAKQKQIENIYKLHNVIIYRTYRIILSIIKDGYIDEALDYICIYEDLLKTFEEKKYHKINDRMKCKIFLLKNKLLLKLIKNI